MLNLAKLAGFCNTLNKIKSFQKTNNISNGGRFVRLFIKNEAKRLGVSVSEIESDCSTAITTFDDLMYYSKKLSMK